MYINDDERSLLSMRHLRTQRPRSLLRRLGGLSTIFMVLVGIILGFMMGYDEASSRQPQQQPDTLVASSRTGFSKEHTHTTPMELLGHVRKTRNRLIEKLELEYGEYTSTIMDKTSLSMVFQVQEGSNSRFRRRIQQKLLKKLIDPKQVVRFRWVTAGDEAAAGLGNGPTQSYTAILRDTIIDAFDAVGIEVDVKNKGFEGYGSAPALALCMADIFGHKIDALSWDFGATDGDASYRAALWGTRATLHPTKPLLLMIDSSNSRRWRQLSRVDGKLGVALLDTLGLMDLADKHLPDTTQLSNPAHLPYAVRYLQCKGAIEGQNVCETTERRGRCMDPRGEVCFQHKFEDSQDCEVTRYQQDWIPGWKDHRIKGRLLGLFLIDQLQDALLELDRVVEEQGPNPDNSWVKILTELNELDSQDQFVMRNSAMSAAIFGQYSNQVSDLTVPLTQKPGHCVVPKEIAAPTTTTTQQPKKRSVRRRLTESGLQETSASASASSTTTTATEKQPEKVVQTLAGGKPVSEDKKTEVTSESEENDTTPKKNKLVVVDGGKPAKTVDSSTQSDQEAVNVDSAISGATSDTAVEASAEAKEIEVKVPANEMEKQGESVDGQPAAEQVEVTTEKSEQTDAKEQEQSEQVEATNKQPSKQVVEAPEVQAKELEASKDQPEQVEATEVQPEQVEVTKALPEQVEAPRENQLQHVESKNDEQAQHVPATEGQAQNVDTTNEQAQDVQTSGLPQGESPPDDSKPGPITVSGGYPDGRQAPEGSVVVKEEESKPVECPSYGLGQAVPLAVVTKADEQGYDVDLSIEGSGAFILACFQSCDAQTCERKVHGFDSSKISSGNILIEVDGVVVTGSREMDNCHFLEGEQGMVWKTKRDQIKIRFRITGQQEKLILHTVAVF